MLELFLRPETWISLVTLTFLEIVLGIDNIIFISIVAGKLPKEQRNRARIIGLLLAVIARLALLFSVAWLAHLEEPLFTIASVPLTGKGLVLIGGGLFLVWKSAQEIYQKMEGPDEEAELAAHASSSMAQVIGQIILIDLVFSLDSIITAVGLVNELPLIVIAILVSLGVMIWASASIADFIDEHPAVKVLALSFLLMIGTLLIAEGFHYHIPKGYVYFSLAFSLAVEMVNIRTHSRGKALPKNASEH